MTATLTAERPLVGIPVSRPAAIPRPQQPQPQAKTAAPPQPQPQPQPDEQLHIHITAHDEYTVVYFIGELDVATYDVIYGTLVSLLCEAGPHLILDLGGVTFTDACGITPLLEASGLATRLGGWVRLVRIPARVRLVLDILHLTEKLSIYDTVSAAATRKG